jgi:hypothetical protein
MKTIRYFIIKLLWKFPWVWRNYCWADAVMWAEFPDNENEIGPAKHDCFYCLACNTDDEINAYQHENNTHRCY